MRYYAAFLDLAGQPCVVLGGGVLAAEKVSGLVEAGARVTVVASQLCPALEELADSGAFEHVSRDFRGGDLQGARLAIDASGDEEINRASWEEAESGGVIINVVDRPERCRFIAPAVVRRDPLLVAISTSGESPYLAAALRARLERFLGLEWGPFTALVGRIRRHLREEGTSAGDQTTVYQRLARSDVRDLLRQGREEEAGLRAEAIAAQGGQSRLGRVALVGAGPGDPELLTMAAREALADAEMVFHDALIDPRTLELCAPEATLVNVGKRGGRPSPKQDEITARMLEAAQAGHDVVRLKGGDPFVFGRGGEEVSALIQAGLEVRVIPGISAALAAPAAAGIPVTMRGISSSIAIVSGHQEPDGDVTHALEAIAQAVDTLVVLMPLANLDRLVARLTPVVGADRPAALIYEATTDRQVVRRGTLGDLLKETIQLGPATLVVGNVVAGLEALAAPGVA